MDSANLSENNTSISGNSEVAASTSNAVVDDPELDALLDDALKDMGKPLPEPKRKNPAPGPKDRVGGDGDSDLNQVWTEEFIQAATAQFEKKIREMAQTATTSASVPRSTTSSMNDPLSKIVEAAAQATMSSAGSGLGGALNSTIEDFVSKPELLQQTAGMSDDELEKLMNSFTLGENFDDKDVDDIMPFMTNMMQKLLSKELLQPVLVDIVERYPDWLADNREKLSGSDFDKYNSQYEYMKNICEEYAKEKDNDSEEVKSQRFDRISELMLKVQCSGPPPKDLVGDTDAAATAGLFGGASEAALGDAAGDCCIT